MEPIESIGNIKALCFVTLSDGEKRPLSNGLNHRNSIDNSSLPPFEFNHDGLSGMGAGNINYGHIRIINEKEMLQMDGFLSARWLSLVAGYPPCIGSTASNAGYSTFIYI
jgi:hypothetical protein